MSATIAACGPGADDAASPRPSAQASSPESFAPSPSRSTEPTPGSAIAFRTSDGVRIAGRLFGDGRVGVVLGHQVDGDQRDWWTFAEVLADHGFTALTINFRGYCPGDGAGCSGDGGTADAWRDLVAGADRLRRSGARTVVLVGASMGGTAAVLAASESDADGAVGLSAPTDCCGMVVARSTVDRVSGPMLFLAGRYDVDAAASARRFGRWAGASGEVVVLDSGEHGVDLVGTLATPDVQRRATRLVLDFIDRLATR